MRRNMLLMMVIKMDGNEYQNQVTWYANQFDILENLTEFEFCFYGRVHLLPDCTDRSCCR